MLSKKNQDILNHLIQLQKEGKLVGEFFDIPNEVYHHPDCPAVSSSNFSHINNSYSHYLLSLDKAREERTELDFRDKFFIGNSTHLAILEPELYANTFAIKPLPPKADKRTLAGKAIQAEWERTILNPWEIANAGRFAMPETLHLEIMTMKASFFNHPYAAAILEKSKAEVSYFWVDEKTGISCKCRTDLISDSLGIILDLKTTGTLASAAAFRKSVVSFNYDRAAAFYTEGVSKIKGKPYKFAWAVIEKAAPYGIQLFTPDEATQEVGQKLFRASLDKMARVHRKLEPETYPTDIAPLGLPAYGFDIDSRIGD